MATFIPNANHDSGQVFSAALTIPEGVDKIEAHLVCPTWLTVDANFMLTIHIDVSLDGGATWQSQFDTAWRGRMVGRGGLLPSLEIDGISAFSGKLARINVEQMGPTLRYSIQGTVG